MKTSICTVTLLACIATAYSQNNNSQPFTQSLRQISAPGNGVLYGLNDKDQIFVWVGTRWFRVEGELRQISAGSFTEVWGVNALNKVYKSTPSGWEQKPGLMKMVSVAKGGAGVVALDLQGRPFAWNGNGWTPFPNAPVLNVIALGAPEHLYGLGMAGEIYRWWPATNNWRRIEGVLKQISVASDGTIAGVNEARQAWMKRNAQVLEEIQQIANRAWSAADQNIAALEAIDVNTSLVVDRNGLLVQRSSQVTADGKIAQDGGNKVDGSFAVPADFLQNPSSQYTTGSCLVLEAKLKIDGLKPPPANMDKPLINSDAYCARGAHKLVTPPDPELAGPAQSLSSVMLMQPRLAIPTSTFYVGNFSRIVPQAGPKVCDAKHFRSVSHHSWVEFRLPDGAKDQQISIPGGAYNNYVFPACNRVWWDNLTFACKADTGWTKIQGNWNADALCHGVTPNHPHIAVGNR